MAWLLACMFTGTAIGARPQCLGRLAASLQRNPLSRKLCRLLTWYGRRRFCGASCSNSQRCLCWCPSPCNCAPCASLRSLPAASCCVLCTAQNGDGFTDLVVASSADSEVCYYENSGGPSPPTWTQRIIASVPSASSMFVSDLDGNGLPDVLSASSNANLVMWHENLGGSPPAWVTRTITSTAQYPTWVEAADVSGDGAPGGWGGSVDWRMCASRGASAQ